MVVLGAAWEHLKAPQSVCDQAQLEEAALLLSSNGHSFVAHLLFLLVIDLRVFSLSLVVCSFPVMKLGVGG